MNLMTLEYDGCYCEGRYVFVHLWIGDTAVEAVLSAN